MRERQPYSRVYWSVVDDKRFAGIYESPAHLGSWLTLLMIADQAHPASAHFPRHLPRRSVKALIDAGLIVPLAANRYRIHGLAAERARRQAESRTGGAVRGETGERGPDGRFIGPPPRPQVVPAVESTGGPQVAPQVVSTDSSQTRRDETRRENAL